MTGGGTVAGPSASGLSVANWMTGLAVGNEVELLVNGARMITRIQHVNPDNLTVRIPVAEQCADVRQHRMHGTAVVSLRDGAANVPVSVWARGDLLVLQFIGPPEFLQRRRHRRVEIDLPVTILWTDDADGRWTFAQSRTLDLSAGGVRIASTATVWPSRGTRVRVRIELPAGELELQAQVIGKTPTYDLRLEFGELSPAAAAQIAGITR